MSKFFNVRNGRLPDPLKRLDVYCFAGARSRLIIQSTRAIRHNSTQATETAKTVSRFDRFIQKTPTKFLRSRLQALKNAPVTHIVSFLLLHEITAIVPLFGLAAAFHYYQWLPPYFAEGAWVLKGVELFGRYFRRKGWVTSEDAAEAKAAAEHGTTAAVEENTLQERILQTRDKSAIEDKNKTFSRWWSRGEGGTRLIVEFATAYAITKVLMPVRIVISIWGAPAFARWAVLPIQNGFKKIFSRKKT